MDLSRIHSDITFLGELRSSNHIKTFIFYTKKIVLKPGKFSKKSFYDVKFSRDHIGIKNLQTELID
ncbi:hypothetical protein Ahy_A02g009664 [Arachis hypogaea]|uniref:Uncharacterized protein n=1 Tax=Arachis hypogaea TaxID=3818 RepID=A0A445EHP3_ARAHY|nr:hypothetical protein Ahy_A02g009664 [Arachis hypogaea]